ncbi:MAG: hypothetical protein ABSB23_20525 [Bryobacteraceae bacterium]|jgi:hypothetical protein
MKPRIRDAAGRFLPGHDVGAATRWKNTSGNPAGTTKSRRAFEAAFYDALLGTGGPEEAAELLWRCARKHEAWAIQALLARIAPSENRLQISAEASTDGTYDLSRLTDAELETFIELATRARVISAKNTAATARLIASGEGAPPAA